MALGLGLLPGKGPFRGFALRTFGPVPCCSRGPAVRPVGAGRVLGAVVWSLGVGCAVRMIVVCCPHYGRGSVVVGGVVLVSFWCVSGAGMRCGLGPAGGVVSH